MSPVPGIIGSLSQFSPGGIRILEVDYLRQIDLLKSAVNDEIGSERAVPSFCRLCCTNRVRDSSRESSVVAVMHEQTHTHDLQDQELASLQ